MEFFEKSQAVRLKTHLDRYLVADDDKLTVRQSSHRAAETRRARWLIEHVESNRHVIRLKSCYGRYLSASNAPFLLGFTGKKVVQSSPENEKDPAIEWQPVRDGFQVMFRAASGGTYLRANGNVPPWRNTVTHDGGGGGPTTAARSWFLWEVEAVEVPEDEEFSDYLELISSYSSVSDELSGLEFGSPASIHSSSFSPRTPMLSMTMKKRGSFQVTTTTTTTTSSVMDLFHNAKAVRLKSHHNKYLHADDDEDSVSQDRNGAAKNNRWTVEFITDDDNNNNLKFIRLKSCYNKYLTASNHPFLLGMTGRKVLQTAPRRLDSSVEWEPVREGNQVKLRTRYGQYLRANGGLPPWRNSVTHDVPHRTATQEWVLWDVDVVDIVVQSPAPGPAPALVVGSDYYSSESSSPTADRSKSQSFERQESTDSYYNSPPKMEEGRAIYYTVLSDDFGEIDENAQGFCINFKGNNINELTRKLEQETGMKGITVCQRNPINRELYPLRLQLPPNNVTMKVIVVQNSSKDSTDDI